MSMPPAITAAINAALAATAQCGAPLDHEACFLAHRGTVYRWATALGVDHHGALECVQETFFRLVRTNPRFPSAAAQTAWLRRVCANIAADRGRARTRGPRHLGAVAEPADERGGRDHEAESAVAQAVDRLSEMQRLVLLCKVCDQMTFAQVAEELQIAVPTAKTHYIRALDAVRAQMAGRIERPQRQGARP
ncbi:MAG: sigma-70 family RNA polymerase sigma factor [Phycisphaeraceae bacterium]|nr:sigma-70 family RNA polymerase sigma factor [Phycisphaeraceae bacterium]